MDQDPYRTLGVSSSASDDEIKKAYRTLAKQWHPDRNPDDPDAETRFKEIGAAFEILSDPDKKALYDEFGAIGLQSGFDPTYARRSSSSGGIPSGFGDGIDLDDLFGGFFSGMDRIDRGLRRLGPSSASTSKLRPAADSTRCRSATAAPSMCGSLPGSATKRRCGSRVEAAPILAPANRAICF